MNVKELIEMLKTFPPDAIIYTYDDDGHLNIVYEHNVKLDSDGDVRFG